MPRSNRRRQPRRRPPPRPTYRGAPVDEQTEQRSTPASTRSTRPAAYIARQTPYLYGELRRVLFAVRGEDGSWNDRVFDRSAGYGTTLAGMALMAEDLPAPARWVQPAGE